MRQETVIICAGGPNPYLDAAKTLLKNKNTIHFVGVDGGAMVLMEAGLPIDLALGDFDSVDAQQKASIQAYAKECQAYSSEKDDTDTELALEIALIRWPEADFIILGGLGRGSGRISHLLANLWLFSQERFKPLVGRTRFLELGQEVRVLGPGQHSIPYQEWVQYVSFVSLTPVKRLAIKQARYNLEPTDLDYPRAFISNEFVPGQDIEFSWEQGNCLIILETSDK